MVTSVQFPLVKEQKIPEMVVNVVSSYCNYIEHKRNTIRYDINILKEASEMLQKVDVLTVKKDENA